MKSILICLIIIAVSCRHITKSINAVQEKLNYDTSKIAIIPFTSDTRIFDSLNYYPCNLTQDDILEIEKIIMKAIDEGNSKLHNQEAKKFFTIDLERGYKMQYVCVVNNDDEKIVFINCFCNSFANKEWKKYLEYIDDGASCAFQLKINLTTKKYFDFGVNGAA